MSKLVTKSECESTIRDTTNGQRSKNATENICENTCSGQRSRPTMRNTINNTGSIFENDFLKCTVGAACAAEKRTYDFLHWTMWMEVGRRIDENAASMQYCGKRSLT